MKPFETGRRSCCPSWAMSCASVGSASAVDPGELACRRDLPEGPRPLTYLYRTIGRDGKLMDAMLSERRDMQAAEAFFRSARATMGFRPIG